VIARATAMHYKGTRKRADRIARELKVDYLLEGSLRRESSEVRVTAQLIQASDQTHRWAQTYDRDLASALVLQSEVAAAIAKEIHLALKPEVRATLAVKRPVSAGAHEDYLKGRYYLNQPHPESLAQSVAWFESAIVKDAGFPLAYASLSHALALLAMVPFDVLPPTLRCRRPAPQRCAPSNSIRSFRKRMPHWRWCGITTSGTGRVRNRNTSARCL